MRSLITNLYGTRLIKESNILSSGGIVLFVETNVSRRDQGYSGFVNWVVGAGIRFKKALGFCALYDFIWECCDSLPLTWKVISSERKIKVNRSILGFFGCRLHSKWHADNNISTISNLCLVVRRHSISYKPFLLLLFPRKILIFYFPSHQILFKQILSLYG